MVRRRRLRLLAFVTLLWAGWAAWAMASQPDPLVVQVVDAGGEPVAGAVVTLEGSAGTTPAGGRVQLDWDGRGVLTVQAEGFLTRRLMVGMPVEAPLVVELRPWRLRGVLTDPHGRPIAHARVEAAGAVGATDLEGRFDVAGASPGPVTISRPGWLASRMDWDGSPGTRTVSLVPQVVKAVHVGGEAAGDRWDEFMALVSDTELNGLMLDLKDEWGLVYYDTEVRVAEEVGAETPLYDLAALAGEAERAGVYLIGRIVTFQDPMAARAMPDMAVGDRDTGGIFEKNGQFFLDPTDPDARAYGMALAEEACRLGVDEIQFDYIRYPDGFGERAVFDGGSDEATRVEAVTSFLDEARRRLSPAGCAVAADVFGFTTTVVGDGGIGQDWTRVTKVLDVVSPMVYPSHYDDGWFGLDRPVDHPGETVRRALEDGIERLETGVVVRPWLQDFGYDASQVRDQIEAAEAFGLGWMLWNPKSNVTTQALDPR
ncbi:MAG: GTP-binding protein [Acidimicrobiia bacterium]|nr:MAG: GTP-binding protein [Acidimicrobiia bacterium]